MERALMLKERAKCIVLLVPVESGSVQSETNCSRQAVLGVHQVLTCNINLSLLLHFPLKGGPFGPPTFSGVLTY